MANSRVMMVMVAAVALSGCGSAQPPAAVPTVPPPVFATAPPAAAAGLLHYRCDQDIEFTVRFADGTAVLDAGARGNDVLLRDAGGATPQQTVYSNPRMRAEFGLGDSGREAILRYAQPPLAAHCLRD